MARGFDACAEIAGGNVAVDEVAEAGPVEIASNEFVRFGLAKVSC